MFKVLVACDTYPPQLNGAAVAAQRLAQGLADRGNRVAVVAPNMAFRDEEQVEPASPGLTVHRIKSFPTKPVHPQFRVPSWVRINAKLSRIFDRVEPDLVHLQNHFILGRGCLKQARKRGIPVIGTNHFLPANLFEYFPKPLRPAFSGVMWTHWMRVYNRLDCVVSPSNTCLGVLRQVGLTAPSRVISNGVDLARFSPAPQSAAICEKYGIRRDVPVFLTVGRLEKDKRVDLVMRAAALANKAHPFQTVVVGKGKDEGEFREMAAQLAPSGEIIFTGFVPDEDLPGIYNSADVYVGAGAAELQGIAVMEAMASGLPILAANSIALPELIEEGGNGFLFGPTAEDLAGKMRQMLARRERWPDMGRHSLAGIQRHEMPAVLEQIEALYREMAAARRGEPAAR